MNFCKHCGSALEQGANFCGGCGSRVQKEQTVQPTGDAPVQQERTAQQTSATLETGVPPQPGKPKGGFNQTKWFAFMKKPIVIVLAVLIIGGASAAAILLNLSPKELYLLSEYKTFQKSVEEVEAKYGKSMDFQEKLLESPSQSELVLSGDVKIPSLEGDPNYEIIRELLGAVSIKANTKVDPVNQLSHYGLALDLQKETALDLELYQSQDQIGVKVPALYSKYLYFNYDQFGDLMRMENPYYSGPETLELSNFTIQDLKLTEDEMEYLKDTYSAFLLDSLPDDNFSLEKGVNYNHNGESMKLRALTLTLSEQEVKQWLNRLLDQLIQDDSLHNMIAERVEKAISVNAMLENEETLDKAEIKKEFVRALTLSKEDLDYFEFPNGFQSTILIDKKEQIVDRQVNFSITEDWGQHDLVLSMKNVPYGKDKVWKEIVFKDTNDEYGELFSLNYTNDVQIQKTGNAESMAIDFVVGEGDYRETLAFTMTSQFNGQGEKQEIQRQFDLSAQGYSYSDMPSRLSGEITQASDVKGDSSDDQFAITLNVEDEYDSGSISLNLDSSTQLIDQVELPNLNAESNDGVNIVTLTAEDLYEMNGEITSNFYSLASKLGLPVDDYGYADYEDAFYDSDLFGEFY